MENVNGTLLADEHHTIALSQNLWEADVFLIIWCAGSSAKLL